MTIELDDFAAVNPRFLVPLEKFEMRIYYDELFLLPDQQTIVRALLSRALREATAGHSDIRPRDLSTSLFRVSAESADDVEGDSVYSSASVSIPVYGFMVQVGRRQMRIMRRNTSVSDLLKSMTVMEDLLRELFPANQTQGSFVDALDMRDSLYGTSFTFSHRVRLVENMNNRASQPVNLEIAKRLLNVDLAAGEATRDSPFGAIQLERLVRADASLIGYRSFDSGPREIMVAVECPHNISQVDVDITSSCRSGDNHAPFSEAHTRDFKTPVLSFFRDLILSQFFDDMFGTYGIEARL